jgi:hypothetical protein
MALSDKAKVYFSTYLGGRSTIFLRNEPTCGSLEKSIAVLRAQFECRLRDEPNFRDVTGCLRNEANFS